MKLIIQIPCFNEEETLPETLADLPRSIPGVETVEWLIVDDGSTDRTVEVALEHGVDHVVRHRQNRGLARAFMSGIERAITLGADIIVNTDADNQYDASCIPDLLVPVLNGTADMAIGNRQVQDLGHFSPIKRFLQRLGSSVVRLVSGTDVADAPSGFRAMTSQAAAQLHVFSAYTYTLETIIQAGYKGFSVVSIPIRANAVKRKSRLVRSIPSYVKRSIFTIVRIFYTYRPFATLMSLGSVLVACGTLIGLRFLYFFVTDGGDGHVQSLILATILLICGFFLAIAGILADLIAVNRKLMENVERRLWAVERELSSGEALAEPDSSTDE